jgi:hypothetical protein
MSLCSQFRLGNRRTAFFGPIALRAPFEVTTHSMQAVYHLDMKIFAHNRKELVALRIQSLPENR